jgi:hypothetical protein
MLSLVAITEGKVNVWNKDREAFAGIFILKLNFQML